MTNKYEHDMALSALLAAAIDVKATLPASLIKASYDIQKRNQFNQDQTTSLNDLEQLVEVHLAQGFAK
jgi:hypothetical protein